ncbi:MAG TPA: flagellar protein FliS, partial [Jatrophihabitans sp.]|nr:flagellar protein FliS [Jatrophihabitans sp.]
MTTKMPAADARARYLADAVATATPAKRIVLLYDRLWLDIQRAQAGLDSADPTARDHLQHAQRIVAELLGSL